MNLTPEEIARLPRAARRKLQAKTRKLMAELGVRPMVDRRTGETVYDLNAIREGLGLSDEEAWASLAEAGLEPHTADRDDLEPLQ